MVSAIVLAAGLSTRMKDNNKLLLPFKNKTIIVTVVENIINAGIKEIIVVTGHHADKIRHLLKDLRVSVIYNDDFNNGITGSIQKGVSIAGGNGYMICLGDMPFITAEQYGSLTAFFEKQVLVNNACICVAQHNNKRGNPVIFHPSIKMK